MTWYPVHLDEVAKYLGVVSLHVRIMMGWYSDSTAHYIGTCVGMCSYPVFGYTQHFRCSHCCHVYCSHARLWGRVSVVVLQTVNYKYITKAWT